MHEQNRDEWQTWEDKLDQHETSLNALLLGLSGALLAFAAGYVKDVDDVVTFDRYFAGSAIVLSSVSLSIGLWRAWLKSSAYAERLAALEYINEQHRSRDLQRDEKAMLEKKRQDILNMSGLTDDERARRIGEAEAAISDEMFDALIGQAEAVKQRAAHTRRLRRMRGLLGPQIITFVAAALALAVIVLHRLAI